MVTGMSPAACSPWPRASQARQVWPCASTDFNPIHSRWVDVSPCSRMSGGPSPVTCTMSRGARSGAAPAGRAGRAARGAAASAGAAAGEIGGAARPARTTGANTARSITRRAATSFARSAYRGCSMLRLHRAGRDPAVRGIIAGRGVPARWSVPPRSCGLFAFTGRCGCRRSPCRRSGSSPGARNATSPRSLVTSRIDATIASRCDEALPGTSTCSVIRSLPSGLSTTSRAFTISGVPLARRRPPAPDARTCP